MFDAIIFDKDGTLFDFEATWSEWALRLLDEIAGNDPALRDEAARAMGFDPARGFHPTSIVIAGTAGELADVLARVTGRAPGALVALANRIAAETPQHPVPGLTGTLARLAEDHVLGLVTNDGIEAARAHLEVAGIAGHFRFVAGYDSGHGFKPEPGPLLAFATATGIEASRTLMVGDSRHDLAAGRAAGMATAAVLTGIAVAGELADLADVVLPDISHLPDWIAGRG